MTRTTIDVGIDLGTTNSEIAVLEGISAKIIRDNDTQMEFIPSAVRITKNNRLYVGREAKIPTDINDGDTHVEFKRNMGTDYLYKFPKSGRQMTPEELSAEVLKVLRKSASVDLQEEIRAAVITVPAAFELPQCDATQRAARLAGFEVTPLLQEPIAAAMAYGFQNPNDKIYWLVYDLGGGTFDAALINMRDGILRVVNHGGDNHLGGKNIDEKIINDLIIPVVREKMGLRDFTQENRDRWQKELAILKLKTEEAKIRLSVSEEAVIYLDQVFRDLDCDAEIKLTRGEVAKIAESLIIRTVSICKDVLSQSRLTPGDVEKLILVGGPTRAPYLKEVLRDPIEGLGIPFETRIDPFTVVAQGAAIFAGTQRLDTKIYPAVSPSQFRIELEYQPISIDDQPIVGGKVIPPNGVEISGYTIEFSRPQWKSGRIPLQPNGTFMTTLLADKGIRNIFKIYLYNQQGSVLEVIPDELSYTIGNTPANPPLVHSVGIALANNNALFYFQKGDSLPVRRKEILRTSISVRCGESGNLIRIPVIEGENKKADRNFCIGHLTIEAVKIRRDIPAGSEVEVTLEIDENRLVTTRAYLPILDEEYEKVIDLKIKTPVDFDAMIEDYKTQKGRFVDLQKQIEQSGDLQAQEKLREIQDHQRTQELDRLLSVSRGESGSANEAQARLIEFKVLLDQLEAFIEWPALIKEAKEEVDRTGYVVLQWGDSAANKKKAELEAEINQAIHSKDTDVLRKKIEDMVEFRYSILWTRLEFHIYIFQSFEKDLDMMQDRNQALSLLADGRRAIQNEDLNHLIRVNRQLFTLLPEDEARKIAQGFGSTVIR